MDAAGAACGASGGEASGSFRAAHMSRLDSSWKPPAVSNMCRLPGLALMAWHACASGLHPDAELPALSGLADSWNTKKKLGK